MPPTASVPLGRAPRRAMRPGDVLLLENALSARRRRTIRVRPGARRARGSTSTTHSARPIARTRPTRAFATHLPAVGVLMERELDFSAGRSPTARAVRRHPRRRQVSDKDRRDRHLLGAVDALLVGGGMAKTFLEAQGKEVGRRSRERQARCGEKPSSAAPVTSCAPGRRRDAERAQPTRRDARERPTT